MSVTIECSIINFMKTKIINIQNNKIDQTTLREAGYILKSGGLVAFPTETVYGLGADALNEEASAKIYAAKGRPSDNPLIVHIAELAALDKITTAVSASALQIAKSYWPGPLTMIFPKSEAVPYGTTGGLDSIAVRMPGSLIARELIKAGGGYIAAPSANTSGRPSPTIAQHVEDDLDGKIEMIIDGGPVEIGVESTILDMTVTPPMILRPGAVTKKMLEDVVGEVTVDIGIMDAESTQAPKAPGMKYRHYAPKAKLCIVEGAERDVVEKINQLAREKQAQGYRVGIIGTEETVGKYEDGFIKSIGTRADENTIAAHLYSVLRAFDKEEIDYIYSESFIQDGIGSAIMNRLLKAAGYHIVKV